MNFSIISTIHRSKLCYTVLILFVYPRQRRYNGEVGDILYIIILLTYKYVVNFWLGLNAASENFYLPRLLLFQTVTILNIFHTCDNDVFFLLEKNSQSILHLSIVFFLYSAPNDFSLS